MLESECGFTPTEIRDMTLFDVQRLTHHWRRQPPLRTLVACCAAALGVKLPITESESKKRYMTAEELDRMLPIINSGGIGG